MSCFRTPYIGVRGCTDDSPASGLFFNDLPSMTYIRGALTAGPEDVTAAALFDRLDEQAIVQTKLDFVSRLSDLYQFNTVVSRDRVGYYPDAETFEAKASGVGLEIERNLNDAYSTIYIQSVDIWTQAGETVTFTITDGVQTEVCDITTTGNGIHNLVLDFESIQEKVTITFDGATVHDSTHSASGCLECDADCSYCDDCFIVRGLNSAGTYSSDLNGLRVHLQCRCSKDTLLCQYEDLLAHSIRLKMGILFLQEAIWGDRANRFVTNKKEDLKEMLVQWNGGVSEITGIGVKGEYWKHLDDAINQIRDSLRRDAVSKCISCKRLRVVSTIP